MGSSVLARRQRWPDDKLRASARRRVRTVPSKWNSDARAPTPTAPLDPARRPTSRGRATEAGTGVPPPPYGELGAGKGRGEAHRMNIRYSTACATCTHALASDTPRHTLGIRPCLLRGTLAMACVLSGRCRSRLSYPHNPPSSIHPSSTHIHASVARN